MEALTNALLLVGGLLILWIGGESLVRGSARLAQRLGISPLVIGLTVVAFGTSAPELAVAVQAALRNEHGIAVGNVLGSNIANILLILGVAAAARPLDVSLKLLKIDGPIMVAVTLVFGLMAFDLAGDGQIERWEGMVLVAGLVGYNVFTYRMARREPQAVKDEYKSSQGTDGAPAFNLLLVVIGIAALTGGGHLIVRGAVGLAELMHVPKTIVGLTIVAVGTSLPELAASVIAARHKLPDIAIGNIVGSNIFNILSVIGITATVRPMDVARNTLMLDGPVVLAASLLLLVVARTGQRIGRREGWTLLALYGGYLAWTVQRGLAA